MSKMTLHDILQMKQRGEPIVMLTAYDYPGARLVVAGGADLILIGDSVGMVVYGFETTLPVTMDMMVAHCQAVRRGAPDAFLIGDMPFMSYQTSLEDAKRNAGRLLAEGRVDAVKLEGGLPVLDTVHALVDMGIAVMGHIGLTPQSVSAFGGFKVQGKTESAARRLIADAKGLESAGAFSMVLEGIPARLAEMISRKLTIPTIGIGAGRGCDGQVLVMHDVLGLYQNIRPRFVKQYADIAALMEQAFKAYREDVKARRFPENEHEFAIPDAVWEALSADLNTFEQTTPK